jgi:hypothetical protein
MIDATRPESATVLCHEQGAIGRPAFAESGNRRSEATSDTNIVPLAQVRDDLAKAAGVSGKTASNALTVKEPGRDAGRGHGGWA